MTSSARTQPPKRIGTNGQKIPLHTLATTTIPGIPRAIAARTAKTNRRERFPLTHSRAPTGYLDDSRLPPPHEDLRNGLREGDHIFFLEAIRGVDSRERRQVLEHVHEDVILERRGDRRPLRVFGADHPHSSGSFEGAGPFGRGGSFDGVAPVASAGCGRGPNASARDFFRRATMLSNNADSCVVRCGTSTSAPLARLEASRASFRSRYVKIWSRRFRTLRSSSWRSRAFGEFGSFWASAFAPPSRRATYAASLS